MLGCKYVKLPVSLSTNTPCALRKSRQLRQDSQPFSLLGYRGWIQKHVLQAPGGRFWAIMLSVARFIRSAGVSLSSFFNFFARPGVFRSLLRVKKTTLECSSGYPSGRLICLPSLSYTCRESQLRYAIEEITTA